MKRINKCKLALFILMRSHYERKGMATMKANMEAYKMLEHLLKCMNYENINRLYEQTELCVLKDRENEAKKQL